MSITKVYQCAVSIIVCQLAGLFGSLFTAPAVRTWYQSLNQPSFTPPNWLFAPVWTILFLLMGIALFLAWNKGFRQSKIGLLLFIFQLLLNVMWSFLFFGLHDPYSALLEIVILLIFILLTAMKFWKISRSAGILLMPYAAWVAFATILNFMFWRLN